MGRNEDAAWDATKKGVRIAASIVGLPLAFALAVWLAYSVGHALVTVLVILIAGWPVTLLLMYGFHEWRKCAQEREQWFGHMYCFECGYRWTSRRQTPPAQCANCRGRNIGIVKGR